MVTYVLEVLYGHEMVGPDYAVVGINQRAAQIMMGRYVLLDDAADKQNNLREMVYSSHIVDWVEFSEMSDLIETETDVLTGESFDEAMEDNQVAAVNRPLDVDTFRGVECEMTHIKPSRVLFSAYVDGWGGGLETAEIPRSDIAAIARGNIDDLVY